MGLSFSCLRFAQLLECAGLCLWGIGGHSEAVMVLCKSESHPKELDVSSEFGMNGPPGLAVGSLVFSSP